MRLSYVSCDAREYLKVPNKRRALFPRKKTVLSERRFRLDIVPNEL
jgi:hypothetical protein